MEQKPGRVLYGQEVSLQNERRFNNMKNINILESVLITGTCLAAQTMQAQNATQPFKGLIGRTLAESKEWWSEPVKAATGTPNAIWVILDDVGFGASSTFGGLIRTPTFDSLASNGLRYTNFHTCAICAPTRAALLTGRNSHSVHMGGFSSWEMSAGFPGWDGRIPSSAGTIAEILRDNGFNTYAVGKWGVTPDEDVTDAGPFDRWPSGKGFDRFFGFLGSQTDQYKPDLVEDNAHVIPDGRHFSEQITDKAIGFIRSQKKADPGKPFFLYYSPCAVHCPHQVDKAWSDLYKGKFDEGWDAYREKVFLNQKKMGIINTSAQLPNRNPRIKAWKDISADERKLYARFMEVFAGYLTYTDHEVGRLLTFLRSINQLENTLVFIIIGDNGASKEGTFNGSVDRDIYSKAHMFIHDISEVENIQHNLSKIDDIGTPAGTATNYPLGWAQATNTPFKNWKQDAHSEGGTCNPLIVYYPRGIKDKGGIRTQYSHVIDILPTTLEFLGIKAPNDIRCIKQDSLQGVSLAYSFTNSKAPSKHTLQYYYIFGSRSIYFNGWKACAAHRPDFIDFAVNGGRNIPPSNYDNDVWELYNLNNDFNECIDLAKSSPEKLKELKALFDIQAKKYNVYPFIDWEDVNKRHVRNIEKRNMD
jgi:arylsulfatase A-like enzyme